MRRNWIEIYLFLTMFSSAFVMVEPSPYDLLMLLFIILVFLFAMFQIKERLFLPTTVLAVFVMGNLVSLYFMTEYFVAIRYSFITFYLMLFWLVLVSLANERLLYKMLTGYLIAAVLAVMIGVAAYFDLLPMSERFLMFDRVKSTFKDPNVFGPFLVLPALYALALTELNNIKSPYKVLSFLLFILLICGIVLSFSRAAWGNFSIAIFLYFIICKKELWMTRMKTILLVCLMVGPVLLYLVQLPFIEELFASRLMMKNYDNDRFATQEIAIKTGILHPFGLGPGQSEYVFEYSPHSLFARVLTENGLLSLVAMVIFLILSAYQAFKNYWHSTKETGVFFLVIFASLIGAIFNSFFIDTLHWRHFWLLLAFAYFPVIQSARERNL